MESTNNLLQKFNSLNCKKSLIHLKDLQLSKKYIVINAKRIETKYGFMIQIELENAFMFLPYRFNVLSDDDIHELTSGLYYVYREGEKNLRLTQLEGSDVFIPSKQRPYWTKSLNNF